MRLAYRERASRRRGPEVPIEGSSLGTLANRDETRLPQIVAERVVAASGAPWEARHSHGSSAIPGSVACVCACCTRVAPERRLRSHVRVWLALACGLGLASRSARAVLDAPSQGSDLQRRQPCRWLRAACPGASAPRSRSPRAPETARHVGNAAGARESAQTRARVPQPVRLALAPGDRPRSDPCDWRSERPSMERRWMTE